MTATSLGRYRATIVGVVVHPSIAETMSRSTRQSSRWAAEMTVGSRRHTAAPPTLSQEDSTCPITQLSCPRDS